MEERWDIYDKNKQLTGRTMKRNDWTLKDDEYHLTVLGVIRRSDGKFLITKRVMTKAWAPGWWEVSGGAAQAGEASYDAVLREVKEETGMEVNKAEYLFSLPNIYVYSGFPVHTLDLFFRCTVADTLHYKAMDDAADLFFIPLKEIRTEDFGLGSIRKGLGIFLKEMSE